MTTVMTSLPSHIYVEHIGGTRKRVGVDALTPKHALVHWSIAGQYDLRLKDGALIRQDTEEVLPWRATEFDLQRMRRAAPKP